MRLTNALVTLACLATAVGSAAAVPEDAPAHALEFSSRMGAPERVRIMQDALAPDPVGEVVEITLEVPAGSALVGHVVDGAWVVEALPLDELPLVAPAAGANEGAGECKNDVPALVEWWSWPDEYAVYPSVFYLAPSLTWPVLPNTASTDMCPGYSGFEGGPTYVQFQTAGDLGGSLFINGWTWWASGTFEVSCSPAGMVTAAGSSGVWPYAGQVRDASCTVTQSGITPPEFSSWYGYVVNSNTQQGMSTYAAAV